MKKNNISLNASAFTLVEMIVVMAVIGLIIGPLYMIFHRSFSGAEAGKAKLGSLQDAVLTLEYIKQDVKGGYFSKTFIKGKQVDGKSLAKCAEGEFVFYKLYYDKKGDEVLKKVSYSFNLKEALLEREEQDKEKRIFAKGKIKKFIPDILKNDSHFFIDITLALESNNKQNLELRSIIFPPNAKEINHNWNPNPY